MEANTILKYKHLSTPALKRKAIGLFHKYIRERDKDEPCINCGNYRTLQAGHYFAAGKYERLRFVADNVNGECLQCNYFDSQSHAQKYRPNLIKKIGEERFNKLEEISKNRTAFKVDRIYLIEIIEKYNVIVKQMEK